MSYYQYKIYYKKIEDVPQKYWPEKEIGPDGRPMHTEESPRFFAWVLDRANNMRNNEERAKIEAKRHEEEQRRMEEDHKQERERRERERKEWEEYVKKLPEIQLQMFLTGRRDTWSCCNRLKLVEFFNHSKNCQHQRGIDAEPGLFLLKEEYRKGKIIRLDDKIHQRLMDFAKDGEPIMELMNRLLDGATAAATAAPQ